MLSSKNHRKNEKEFMIVFILPTKQWYFSRIQQISPKLHEVQSNYVIVKIIIGILADASNTSCPLLIESLVELANVKLVPSSLLITIFIYKINGEEKYTYLLMFYKILMMVPCYYLVTEKSIIRCIVILLVWSRIAEMKHEQASTTKNWYMYYHEVNT